MQLNFPSYNFTIKRQENANYVFDIIRKKFVLLTPEEWVRQHVIHFLTGEKGFPASLLAVERGLEINGRKKRFDLLAFDRNAQPLLIVECKAPEIALNQETLNQVAIYNSEFGCRYLLVTNGLQHMLVTSDPAGKHVFTPEIPFYKDLH